MKKSSERSRFTSESVGSILALDTHDTYVERRQRKFYSLPKRYKQSGISVFLTLIPDEGPLLETSNLFVYRLGSE